MALIFTDGFDDYGAPAEWGGANGSWHEHHSPGLPRNSIGLEVRGEWVVWDLDTGEVRTETRPGIPFDDDYAWNLRSGETK